MILIKERLEDIRGYCEAMREDAGSNQPYFIEDAYEDGWLIPEDSLIENGILEMQIPYKFFITFRGKPIIIEPDQDVDNDGIIDKVWTTIKGWFS